MTSIARRQHHTSRLRRILRWGRLALPLLALACNQPPPPVADGDGSGDAADDESSDESTIPDTPDGETGTEKPSGSLYPLVDGATWTYLLTTNSGQVEGMEIVNATEITWDGDQAWELIDNPNDKGNWTQSVIVRDGDRTMRVHKQQNGPLGIIELVDYDPGFTRANDQWDTVGEFEEQFYDRIAYDASGENPVLEPRGHSYEVIAIETITVPAGTFEAVQVERVRTVGAAAGERVISWYVPGVGKIRELRPADSTIEELVSVAIPGGANLP